MRLPVTGSGRWQPIQSFPSGGNQTNGVIEVLPCKVFQENQHCVSANAAFICRTLIKVGGFTLLHIKTPKKRGARISGQLICEYIIPQLEIVSITLIEWFNYVVHRIIWASIFFERKLCLPNHLMCDSGTNVTGLSSGKLSRSFDRHLLKL